MVSKTMKRVKVYTLVCSGAAIVLGIICANIGENQRGISLNEICSWNETVIRDSEKRYSDYIELYNSSAEAISLYGWYLSDDKKCLDKVALPDIVIEPGEYLLLYANGEDEGNDSLQFKISSNGESVFLSDSEGNLVDSIVIPALNSDTVYARAEDGSGEWKRMKPSPGETNADCEYLKNPVLNTPRFSRQGGFYDEAFYLKMYADPGETIYYTLDGSTPTENSLVYEEPILIDDISHQPNVYNTIRNVVEDWKNYTPSTEPVDKAVVVRAVAMDEKDNISEIVTATYLVGLELYTNADVISVVADPEDLFGENGIYVTGKEYDEWYLSGKPEVEEIPEPNFEMGGRDWEIGGNIELYENGDMIMNQPVGLRIQGAYSRGLAKKRFSVYARREYGGSNYFDAPIFEGRKIHSFVLREGFANAVTPQMVKDMEIGTQEAKQVVVFLNGEYWYTVFLQEKINKYYLHDVYGVDMDNVSIVQDWETSEGRIESEVEYAEMLDWFAQTDFSDEQSFRRACDKIDMQSFIDFICASVYLCNMDMSEGHNHIIWKSNENRNTEYEDGKWRWILYDLDQTGGIDLEYYNVSNQAEINAFSTPRQHSTTHSAIDDMVIFSALRHNEEFNKQFVLSFMDMANTCFSVENVEEVLKKNGETLHWHDDFFLLRYDNAVEHLKEEFSLSGTLEKLNLKINDPLGGYVKLNTCIPDLEDGEWSGKYYTDFSITLTAVPREGYYFAGWEGDLENTEEEITIEMVQGGIDLTAIFEKVE